MTIPIIVAYFLIALFFVIERLLRKSKEALSLKPGVADAGSSQILWFSSVINLLLFIMAPTLNTYQIGYWENKYIAWAGVILMLSGIIIRYWAAKTLDKFYTRTLQIIEGQEIVTQAPYNLIRHPGYLGTFMLGFGAALSVTNWVILSILVVIEFVSKDYRINAEEKMLEAKFGEDYKTYSNRTWKLVSFIY